MILTCSSCSASKNVTQPTVDGVATADWFAQRGKLCTSCYERQVADVRAGRVHKNGPSTEREAAESVSEVTGRLRAQVLQLLQANPTGLTDDEGGAYMDGDRLTFGRRRQELVQAGRVIDSGQRRVTPRGRKAVVWVLS